ncbi:unnamed protein product [Blepharisma stoltei]|uniref:Uncharacterized protein n=1 Tax=Blepharisma stoltei TaxID=1481888 RepID=A0AAU9K8E4_9CILI|nr:unnamed protein product [Blepharisma stoltei]
MNSFAKQVIPFVCGASPSPFLELDFTSREKKARSLKRETQQILYSAIGKLSSVKPEVTPWAPSFSFCLESTEDPYFEFFGWQLTMAKKVAHSWAVEVSSFVPKHIGYD